LLFSYRICKKPQEKLAEKFVINKHFPHMGTSLMCYYETKGLGCYVKKCVLHIVVIGIFMNSLICVCNNVFDE